MRVSMQDHGTDGVLDTRSRGAKARWSIERQLAASGQSEALVLDFAKVRAVTVPFVDECIGKLLAGRSTSYYDDHPVMAVHANDDVRETIAMTLSRGRLALLHASNPPQLLGADNILNDTLREARALQRFSAFEMSRRLGISTQAANNRLKALVAMGALRRVLIVPAGGGKEFAYSVPEAGLTRRRPTSRKRTRSASAATPRKPAAA